ncbi:Glutamate dehydrogenase (NADP(+)) [Desulfobulbus propionicus DSM 2032]|uniref:Probable molybdenum cofactor guanylyltransferase n=1 Tax=Desulfobulbus propionicus (strain ATCC 33891 / DSM 2032 / VKM B-1956 / 1pr3) TaxID=577650 RepID=A0A7U4DQD2_DESPD|nr:Glutamate dehydrogenase (NADP(+)) [Desulfobulbus propionicus DSM 2032]
MMSIREHGRTPVWGCVLIGGKSSRMGTPKHLLETAGRTWIERTVAVLRGRVEQVVIAGAGALPAALAEMIRVDDVPGLAGPLAGILAAFRAFPDVSWLVVACDLPDMGEEALQWLLDCRQPGVVAVMPDLAGNGRVEPLLAYYDQSCRPLLEAMAASNQRRINQLRSAPGVATPRPPEHLRPSWRNVNTPRDLGTADSSIGRGSAEAKQKPAVDEVLATILRRDPEQREFHQAVGELLATIRPVLDRHPEYRRHAVVERLVEPERMIMFRVPWMDDQGAIHVNRGYRVEMNSAIGPYKGGLRFHPSVNLSIIKFLAFEQVFKNSLTTLAMGGAKGGADFDPKGRSDAEIMRFCQAFMAELFRHIGEDTDVPAGDIGVGAREIGYLFGMYKKLQNKFTGVLTGKGLAWGGSLIRPEATGYGVVYFTAAMLAHRGETLAGKRCLVSGSGNVAQFVAEKIVQMGGTVLSLSDSSGHIYDEEGIDASKLEFIKTLKNIHRGRIGEYSERYPHALYVAANPTLGWNPLWRYPADCALPAATQNELNLADAQHLAAAGVRLVCEGANMPSTPEAIAFFRDQGILFGPAKAANAGGVAVSGLEMAQDAMRISWSREEVEGRLRAIMHTIHRTCLEAAAAYGLEGDYLAGANIAGFVKVADAMLDQGLV